MSEESYAAVLNPFSKEGKEIVNDAPPFDSLPEEVIEKAVNRVNERSGPEVKVDFDEREIRNEVLSFYLMCQGVASVSYPYSNEVRTIADVTRDTIKYRMYDLFNRGYENLCLDIIDRFFRFRELEKGDKVSLGPTEIPKHDIYKIRDLELRRDGIDPVKEGIDDSILPQYIPKYAIRWTDLTSLIEHRRMDLTKEYVVDGWALITPKKLWAFFANFVCGEMEDYIEDLYDKFSAGGPPSEVLKDVGQSISEVIPQETKKFETPSAASGKLRPENFPPCVKNVLGGVASGNRNYGIVVLLTSFLSYARISPSGKTVERVADFIDDISVIEDDIIPLIFEAAENCKPPLFKDQPQDKANVYYHMGLGMTTQPRLRDSGKSKWYRPPNCRKIRAEAPELCDPDELCSDIKNPLTYYYKSLSKSSSSGGE